MRLALLAGSIQLTYSSVMPAPLHEMSYAQAALRSAVGLTMPQTTQHSLIHVLLLWISILSIIQVVFITLFFTTGHHSWSWNSSTVAPARPMQFQANNTPSAPSEHRLLTGKVEMLTFKATEDNRKITWETRNQDQILVSEEEGGKFLKIKKDGYFFLSLQVTLSSCNHTLGYTVRLKSNDKDILHGWINTITCSTGLLGKVEELSANDILEVIINWPNTDSIIDERKYLTHFNIVFLPRN
ncbi:hypothetical protein PBY51_007784 [Eleginops maclovinus]|uniref:TNF family profile domain-containing protein n=1 Tax=Eleginops maclovinus TaxID=56733 RepID=A0AAN8ADT3_ELEMC|nr:hypothetical protein PBY51_007784 [Eleginops maclovinus]